LRIDKDTSKFNNLGWLLELKFVTVPAAMIIRTSNPSPWHSFKAGAGPGRAGVKPENVVRTRGSVLALTLAVASLAGAAAAQSGSDGTRPIFPAPGFNHTVNGHHQPTQREIEQLDRESHDRKIEDKNGPATDRDIGDLYRQLMQTSAPQSQPAK
jgi:hypothetical protein